MVLEDLATAIREEKEIKGIQIGKEGVKVSLFADDMILYIENPKDTIRKLLELINEYSKVSGIKLIHRNPLHSYILTMQKQKEKLRKLRMVPFTIAMKRIKYLGVNLPKETKDTLSLDEYYFLTVKFILGL